MAPRARLRLSPPHPVHFRRLFRSCSTTFGLESKWVWTGVGPLGSPDYSAVGILRSWREWLHSREPEKRLSSSTALSSAYLA